MAQEALGMAITAPNTGVIEGPPASQEEFEQWKQGFLEYFQRPEVRAALMQFGTQLAQPRSVLQSPLGHLQSAVASGAQAAGKVGTEQQRMAEEAAKLDVQNRQVDVQSRGVDVQNRNAGTAEVNAETEQGRLAETIRSNQIGEQHEGTRLSIDADRVDVEAERVRLAEETLNFEKSQAGNDAGVKAAQARLADAQARYYDAKAKNPGDSADIQYINTMVAAMREINPQMTEAEATVKAAEFAKGLGGMSTAAPATEIYTTLRENTFGEVDDAKLLEKAKQMAQQFETGGGLMAGTVPPTGTPPPTAAGTPPPAAATTPQGNNISLPPDIAPKVQASVGMGGQFVGVEMKTLKGGGTIPIFMVKNARGEIEYYWQGMKQ